ncbi:MAG: TOBE domain-containing protein [Chloroflexi bacterium]|nr:TOBE domain-containing protein [Chloroflexota bacterium]
MTLERLGGGTQAWAAQIVSAAFLGNQFEYVVQVGGVRIHAQGPKYDPLLEGDRVRVLLRAGSYGFWSDSVNGKGDGK